MRNKITILLLIGLSSVLSAAQIDRSTDSVSVGVIQRIKTRVANMFSTGPAQDDPSKISVNIIAGNGGGYGAAKWGMSKKEVGKVVNREIGLISCSAEEMICPVSMEYVNDDIRGGGCQATGKSNKDYLYGLECFVFSQKSERLIGYELEIYNNPFLIVSTLSSKYGPAMGSILSSTSPDLLWVTKNTYVVLRLPALTVEDGYKGSSYFRSSNAGSQLERRHGPLRLVYLDKEYVDSKLATIPGYKYVLEAVK